MHIGQPEIYSMHRSTLNHIVRSYLAQHQYSSTLEQFSHDEALKDLISLQSTISNDIDSGYIIQALETLELTHGDVLVQPAVSFYSALLLFLEYLAAGDHTQAIITARTKLGPFKDQASRLGELDRAFSCLGDSTSLAGDLEYYRAKCTIKTALTNALAQTMLVVDNVADPDGSEAPEAIVKLISTDNLVASWLSSAGMKLRSGRARMTPASMRELPSETDLTDEDEDLMYSETYE
ncbi:hypothetical protein J8273_7680 [Carpediemonas membranifera]|uniref:LisH domain-containing protein n=1 Tax=Carpediemonas membranifera TaxID=201153 RepID=A0A8J6E193_9EUKA|nr:hypothetical protein J8273_7680 [Carpediemonas membranifera]|eukprot:KAG9390337.1 hypothetical protein J8273_7680 [Carpediemonas membranifera]